jgi:hypothetical protein
MKYQFFPRSIGVTKEIEQVVACFLKNLPSIESGSNTLSSNAVLAIVADDLEALGYSVERGKSNDAKINVPVLFGENDSVDRVFYADALSADGRIVIEVEAGRATENNQFLKDIFQACMMFGVEYLVMAVRQQYRNHEDYAKIYSFLETLYISNRLHLPLKGILLIGY